MLTNNNSTALDYTLKSLEIANELELLNTRKHIHEQLSKIYSDTKDYKKAYYSHMLFKELNDSIFNEKNIKEITGLENKYKFEKEKQAIKLEQEKKDAVYEKEVKFQKSLRNYFIIGFILTVMLILLGLRNFLEKRKANRILAAQKRITDEKNVELINSNKEISDQNELIKLNTKMLVQLEKDKHKAELDSKQKDVELLHINNQMKINMKHELIKDLQTLKKDESNILKGVNSIINHLKYEADEEGKIDLLQESIDIIGTEFHERIRQQFSGLTRSEVELLSFIKLKLSNKQMAIQKNTSPNTINVALHRLKSKCNFKSTIDLKHFIESF